MGMTMTQKILAYHAGLDTVKAGQLIAKAADGLSVPQHASISGKVILANQEKIIIQAK